MNSGQTVSESRPAERAAPLFSKPLAVAGLLLVGGYAVGSLALPRGHALTAFGDIGQCLAAAFAAAALLLNGSSRGPRTKAFWLLMGLGTACWLVGQMLWTYFEVILRQPVPNPFLGDVILFLHAVPMIGALALQPHDPGKDLKIHLGYIDFSLLLVWWVYLYLFLVIPWQYIAPDVQLYGQSYDNLEGMENLILTAGLLALAVRARKHWRFVYGHLVGAAALFAVGAYVTNVAIDRQKYYTGSVYDFPLVAGLVWFGTAGLMARRLPLPSEASAAPQQESSVWPGRLAATAVVSMPLLALWVLQSGMQPLAVRDFRLSVTQVTILVVAFLIFVRQKMVGRDRLRLLHSSQESLENLKRLQTQLIQAEKLASLGQLAAGAAHEINNPLTGILGYSDLLVDNETLDPQSRAIAEKIRTLARRIKRLVSNLLSFSRQVPGEKTVLDLNGVLQSALHLNELDLRGKHITVDINVDPKLPSVRGDANQLLQVFFNVINNAVDAMQEVGGGRLTIATRQDGSNAVAEFSDTGPGMAAPHLVFDPFYTTKPVGKGTGLGLSICYGILQEHGGRIRCYNRPEGGATFRVELPAVFVEVPARDAEPQHAVESR
jgi:signal transduction histidine kinase